jgi:ATP synthase protein I
MERGTPDGPPSLDDLGQRLKQARDAGGERKTGGSLGPGLPDSSLGVAMRIGVELVAGVAVGGGIGYALDRWLDTGPWLLIVFFFLGAGAGIMNVYRAATGQGLQVGYRRPDDGDGGPGGGRAGKDQGS